MKYIDTHTHYDHYRYRKNRNELLQQIQDNDEIKHVINATIGQASMINMSEKLSSFSKVLFTVGKHPVCAAKEEYSLNHNDKQLIEQLVWEPRTVAVGETGIDTYRTSEKSEINNQEEWFNYFINLNLQSKKR